jgi:outer membrane protein
MHCAMSNKRKICKNLCAAILLSAAGGHVHAQDAGAAAGELGERDVVKVAVEHYPGLSASLRELESARWGVVGEEGRYGPVLVLDGNFTRAESQSPFTGTVFSGIDPVNMVPLSMQVSGVSETINRRAEAGAELKKHLTFGTDLSLRVSGGWQDTQNNRNLTFVSGDVYLVTTKLTLKQPLLRGRGRDVNEATLRSMRVQQSEAEHARDRLASELLRDVLGAYWELWYAERTIAIEDASRGVAQKQRDQARARTETGSLAVADVLSFETEVAQRDEALLAAKGERQQREHELRRLLGVLSGDAIALPDAEPEVRGVSASADAEVELLAESRALREAKAQVERARLEAKTAADPLRSRLDFDSYVQVQGVGNGNDDIGNPVSRYGTDPAVSAFVSLTYEQPLDSRQHRAAAARARLSVEVAEQRLRELQNQELTQLHAALSRHEMQRARIDLTRETVRIAEQQLAAQEARFVSGSTTPLAVIEAEDGVRTARLRVARAQADLELSTLAIEHATGRLLERYAKELSAQK